MRRCVGASAFALLAQAPAWLSARPDYAWSFPRDHWAHPGYKTEWWYFTGQLADPRDSTRRFGYQFTMFRVGILPTAPPLGSDWSAVMLVMGHAAITDLGAGTHAFAEVVYRGVPMLGGFGAPGDSLVAWSRAPAGTDDRWTLRWTGDGFAFRMADARQGLALDLATRAERPLVLQGPNGYSSKGPAPGTASQYYSFTRLATRGTVTSGGRSVSVAGTSWMDKEFGSNQLERDQVGWDWFSLQLDDGRDLMLYLLRDSTGATRWANGTVVAPDGTPRYLGRADFDIRATARWTSDSTRAEYPARWTVSVPSERITLDVLPLVADQENRSAMLRRMFYWEGAVTARDDRGRALGRGYVELVGYGRALRPAL